MLQEELSILKACYKRTINRKLVVHQTLRIFSRHLWFYIFQNHNLSHPMCQGWLICYLDLTHFKNYCKLKVFLIMYKVLWIWGMKRNYRFCSFDSRLNKHYNGVFGSKIQELSENIHVQNCLNFVGVGFWFHVSWCSMWFPWELHQNHNLDKIFESWSKSYEEVLWTMEFEHTITIVE